MEGLYTERGWAIALYKKGVLYIWNVLHTCSTCTWAKLYSLRLPIPPDKTFPMTPFWGGRENNYISYMDRNIEIQWSDWTLTMGGMTAKEGSTEKSGWPSYKYLRSERSVRVTPQPTVITSQSNETINHTHLLEHTWWRLCSWRRSLQAP